MTYRHSSLLLVVAVAAAYLLSSATAGEQAPAPKDRPAPPEMVKWNLDRLNQEPVKLIKSTPDPRTGQIRFLLEFTRAPKPSELLEWEQRGGLAIFKFLDEDGVAIRAARPQWEGELTPKKGTRMRLILQLPDDYTLHLTRSVIAE